MTAIRVAVFGAMFCLNAMASTSNKVITGVFANSCYLQGELKETGRAFDIGVSGEGFLPLLDSDGSLAFTRYGSLGMNGDGFLEHLPSGLAVVNVDTPGDLRKIQISEHARMPLKGEQIGADASLTALSFQADGVLLGFYSDGQTAEIAKLQLAIFQNIRHLELRDAQQHLFKATVKTGEVAFGQAMTAPFGKIFGRSLEEVPEDRYSKKCL